MTTQPQATWLYVASLRLAAVSTAASVARAFVRQHLSYLKLHAQVEDAELVISELVTNAVAATGITKPDVKLRDIGGEHLIGVQLRLVDSSLFLEVWDRSINAPVKQTANDESEHGRGLVLVEALTRRCGVFHPPAGGKVVWGELAVTNSQQQPENQAPPLQPAHDNTSATPSANREQVSAALLARVLEGLGE